MRIHLLYFLLPCSHCQRLMESLKRRRSLT
jgi:hypothetical protein